MSSFILPRVSRQTGKLRKKIATDNNQMSGLPDFIFHPRHRHLRRFAFFFSSQPTGGCSRTWRWHRTGSELQQLWREQPGNKLLFCLPEFSLRLLFSISPTLQDHERSSQCFDRQTTSSRCAWIDPPTCDVLTAISWRPTIGILLWRLQSSDLP